MILKTFYKYNLSSKTVNIDPIKTFKELWIERQLVGPTHYYFSFTVYSVCP